MGWGALALLGMVLAGCQPVSDGAPCKEDDDCQSGVCWGGVCSASKCRSNDGCEPGWECLGEGSPPGCFLCDSRGACFLPCAEGCPEEWTCESGYCRYAPEVRVDPGGPYYGEAGMPMTFGVSAVIPDGYEDPLYTWSFATYEVWSQPTMEFTFAYANNEPITATVKVRDRHGFELTGRGTTELHVCSNAGGTSCSDTHPCCGDYECRTIISDYDGYEYDRCVPPAAQCEAQSTEADCEATRSCGWVEGDCNTPTSVPRCISDITCDGDDDCPASMQCVSSYFDACFGSTGGPCGCSAKKRCATRP